MTAKKKLSDNSDLDIINEVNRVPMTQSSRERMSLNIYDLQYLIRLQDLSNEAFKQTFDEEFRIEVAKSVAKELAEVLSPINDKLAELATGQKAIAADILDIKRRLDEMEDKVETEEGKIKDIETRLNKKKKKLAELEEKVAMLQPDYILKFKCEIEELKPLLLRSIKCNSFWNVVLRIISGVVIGIIAMYFILKHWWVNLF